MPSGKLSGKNQLIESFCVKGELLFGKIFFSAAKTWDHFLQPLKMDCEELLGRFQMTESVRYEEFAAVWRDMDFSSLFYGDPNLNDRRIFTRLAFATTYNYLLPPYSFQIRVGALYMLFGMYHIQLTTPKEKIWMALKDWEGVQKFVQDAISCQHLDVIYVYKRLVCEKALLFCAMPKQLMYQVKRKAVTQDVCEEFRDRPARVFELISAETLDEITNIQGHYDHMKEFLSLSSKVGVTPLDLPGRLQHYALDFHQWQEQNTHCQTEKGKALEANEKITSQQSESSQRAELLAAIKSKSYKHLTEVSKSRRHRQVEMDTSGSGTDHAQEPPAYRRRRPPSLRARTWKSLGGKGEDELTKFWILSSKEEDKSALKRRSQRYKFKW